MKKFLWFSFLALLLGYSPFVKAALLDRGGDLIYDDVLDITWLQDANYQRRYVTWSQAMAWADQLVYGGFDDWRLPDAHNQDGSGPDHGFLAGGEMGYMYYNNLKNPKYGPLSNMGPFANIQSFGYWTQTKSDYGPLYVWTFNFGNGATDYIQNDGARAAWAVRAGDAPIPSAAWLLGSGLIGLVGLRKKFSK